MIPCLNDLLENENEVYFQQDWTPPHFLANVSNFLDRTFRDVQEVLRSSASISRFNPSRLLPSGNFKEHCIRHKTTNTAGSERSDWTCHKWYSISNNPDGTSLILNMYGFKEVYGIEHNTHRISVSLRCWEITIQRMYTSIWDTRYFTPYFSENVWRKCLYICLCERRLT